MSLLLILTTLSGQKHEQQTDVLNEYVAFSDALRELVVDVVPWTSAIKEDLNVASENNASNDLFGKTSHREPIATTTVLALYQTVTL